MLPLPTQSAVAAFQELPSTPIMSVLVSEDTIKMSASVMLAPTDVPTAPMQMSALPALTILLEISMTTATV